MALVDHLAFYMQIQDIYRHIDADKPKVRFRYAGAKQKEL
jgi:hypothetical protein